MAFTHSFAEILILGFVSLNCYVNVVRFHWDRKKRNASATTSV